MRMVKHTLALILSMCMILCSFSAYADTGRGTSDSAAEGDAAALSAEDAGIDEPEDEASGRETENTDEQNEAEKKETETEDAEDAVTQKAAEDNEGGSSADDEKTKDGGTEAEPPPEVSFTADQADCLSYDPLYIAKYANKKYINTDEIEMERYYNVVTAAKGVATYNIARQNDFEVTEHNYLAGMNYEMPVYNIDDESRYYAAIPDVNKFNSNFKAYDLMLAYNNDNGETISGWKYEKGILYIPKAAIDRPKNEEGIPERASVAVQLNYAIGSDMDFSKTIPVQILTGREPVDKTVSASNIFDIDDLSVNTGVRGRKESDISVFLNGHMIPINRDAWKYDSSSGVISIEAMPGIVSNINIVFERQSVKEKIRDIAVSALGSITDEAYAAVSTADMKVLRNDKGEEVMLDFDREKMFVGWRGHYKSKVIHKNDASSFNGLSGWRSSVSYLYGGATSMSGSDMDTSSDKEIDAGLTPLWAIQSYAVGADVGLQTDTKNIQFDTQVRHYVSTSETEKHTMYEWLLLYRNKLEKSKEVYADRQGNSIGGANNFAIHYPIKKVSGSDTGLRPNEDGTAGRENPDIKFESEQISSDDWFAASCSELDDAAASDEDSDIYMTCLKFTNDYVVFAFVQARSGQNACAIYKFKLKPRGYVYIKKVNASSELDYPEELPVNYSLQGAVYQLFSDEACTKRAKDTGGADIELVTDETGATAICEVEPGDYYIKEVTASKGFRFDPAVSGGNSKKLNVSADDTEENPAVFISEEPPAYGKLISLRKTDATGKNGWKKLIGAEYTLRHYDADPDTSDVSGMSPKRSWTFRTVKKTFDNGEPYAGIEFSSDEPVKGSDPFYMEDGKRIMPCGVFTIEETKAPSGLARNQTVYYGKVYQTANGSDTKTEMNVKTAEDMRIEAGSESDVVNDEEPQGPKIIISKKNASTGISKARESEDYHSASRLGRYTSLAGAVYEVYYDDNDLALPELVGTIVTDENGYGELTKREAGDERFLGDDLPLGDYIIKEVKAPSGFVTDFYRFNEDERAQEIAGDADIEVICGYDDSGKPVTKLISGKFKDGRHLFKTRAETLNTESFEYTVSSYDEPTRTYIKKTDSETGKELSGARLQIISLNTSDRGSVIEEWVSAGEEHIAWELPAGKYMLRELTAPYGYDVAEDMEFEIKSDNIVTSISMENRPMVISTSAKDDETGSHHGSFSSDAVIRDTVKISGLYAGRKYLVKGRLTDKATGETLKDSSGNESVSEAEFTASGVEAEIELSFKADSSGFTEDSVAVGYERIFRTSAVHTEMLRAESPSETLPVELQKHEDPEAEVQSIHYGGIASTSASEKSSKEKNVIAGEDVTVIDLVSYSNLSPEETYIIEGELYDRTEAELSGIKARAEFSPNSPDGVYAVEFRFDASGMEGHSFTAFETLSVNGVVISRHEDESNKNQTVYIPKLSTKVGNKNGKRVTDTVSYKNLIPGKRYVIKGWFVDRKTGKKIKNSEGKTEFTPEKKSGSVGVKLWLGSAKSDVVAYEYCYLVTNRDDAVSRTLVAKHEDIEAASQTVRLGKSAPKTSDDSIPVLYLLTMMMSAALIAVMKLRRRFL